MIVNELMTEEQKFVQRYWPENWLEYAEEMKEAADELRKHASDTYTISFNSGNNQVTEEPGLSAPWLFLARTSLDYLLKGLIVAYYPLSVSNGKFSTPLAEVESLMEVYRYINTPVLNRNEQNFLEFIDHLGGTFFPDIESDDEREFPGDIHEAFTDVFEKLKHHLYNAYKHGWDGPHGIYLGESVRSDMEVGCQK